MSDQETVTIIQPTGLDGFGDPLPGTTTEVVVEGCLFAPGPSVELVDGADQVTTDGTVYGPPGMPVRAVDLVRARGQVFRVVGDPQDWGSSGVVVLLRKVTG